MKLNFCVPCLLGVEALIAREAASFGAGDVVSENGKVFFSGGFELLARHNICSRFSERLQIVIGSFNAYTFTDLFEGVKALPWEEYIGRTDAFPVKGYSLNSKLFSVSDCQSIIKKAVVERLKQRHGLQWFDETGPVHQIQFSIMKDKVHLLLDTSGEGLHKRGYRPVSLAAPIKETLAAALCEIARLKPYHTLYDPMCGSGTILIEGAMMAMNMPPGVKRNFSAERWDQIPRTIWQQERERALSRIRRDADFAAFGSDIDENALRSAQMNAAAAGVADKIKWKTAPLKDFAPASEKGTVICNPPYGERMEDAQQARLITQEMGRVFPAKHGWSYTVISPSDSFEEDFGRPADKRRKIYNGMIKCQVYMYFH
ncbi:MAG TPA: class I SAM-dependent RNA methyltransferase [Clostridiales bacterium]|nr:MAG: Ribosomal RNA large subunit methyltransferase K [Firmicutes bacterium ADurb.Bin262]HOU10928.1 class I SAM-dependent RNA methyltransferase [Clostridiales bacterium]HQH63997.1 class I SAM-dependent RNA methyltransferase [Clostridiales bacterium]HQK72953.1 class I SAM-dependent RNA methyltransferase [Clostridiales bacterium]